mmetsp:Transcript_5721/g.8305  ORF Transcript_5721/g.8305 Transcript_5721/m.8305 type:complete len:101 (+) Transcript_5721:1546-1848(+)
MNEPAALDPLPPFFRQLTNSHTTAAPDVSSVSAILSIFDALSWWMCHFGRNEELFPSTCELTCAIERSISLKLTMMDAPPMAIDDNYGPEEACSVDFIME